MKKLVTFILLVCCSFLIANAIWTANISYDGNSSNHTSNLLSVSEFTAVLEDENIGIENTDEYNICVLIELENSLPYNSFIFDASNISADDSVDIALKTHRENVKDYYSTFNEENAEYLGLEKYEYHISYYSPHIEIIFDDIEEYELYERELIHSITNTNIISDASNYAVYNKQMQKPL